MKHKFAIIPLLFIFSFLLIPAQAQTVTNTPVGGTGTPMPLTWCYKFNFRVSNGGWVRSVPGTGASMGDWSSGNGWVASNDDYFAEKIRGVAIQYTGSIGATVHSMTIEWSYDMGTLTASGTDIMTGSGQHPLKAGFGHINTGNQIILTKTDALAIAGADEDYIEWVHQTFNSGIVNSNALYFITSFSSSDATAPLVQDGDVTIHSVEYEGWGTSPFPTSNCGAFAPTPTPTLTPTPSPTITPTPLPESYVKPLAASADGPWGMVNHRFTSDYDDVTGEPEEDTVLAFANTRDVYIHVGAEGIVTSVRQMSSRDCQYYFNEAGRAALFGWCSFTLSDVVTGTTVHQYHFPGDSATDAFDWEMPFYEVEIDVAASEDVLKYIVVGAPNFVDQGQTVSEGCVIGRTLAMRGIGFSLGGEGGFQLGLTTSPYSVAVMTVERPENTIIDGLPLLTVEPPESVPCNQSEEFEGCLGDVALVDNSSWQTKDAIFTGSGVVLDVGGYISTLMNLDSAELPEMIVYARGIASSAFTMQLGETTETFSEFTILPGQFKDYIIEADAHLPDSGGMYTVKITNTSPLYPLEIGYICVRHTDGESLDPPSGATGTCTFTNHNFYNGTTDWTGSIEAVSGGVAVGDGDTISQTVTLPAGDYYLSSTLLLNYVGYTPDPSDTAKTLLIEYRFPSGGSYEEALNYTAAQIAAKKNQLQFKVPFTVSSTATSSFTVSVDLSGFDSAMVYGVVIKSLCIFPTSQEGPLVETCTPMAEPSGDEFGSWTRWLWHQQNQFFLCTLMITLNDMYDLGINMFKLAGWTQRYSMAFAQGTLNWVSYQALPWLGGYLSNIQPQVTSSGGCNTFWCLGEAIVNGITSIFTGLLDTLNLLINQILRPILDVLLWIIQLAFSLIYDVLVAIISLFFLLLTMLIEAFVFAKDLLFSVIVAWNTATPTAVPGMWDCSDIVDVHAICWFFWLLENTVFSGAGALIIPMLVSIGYIILAITGAKRTLKMIKEVGESL
jgi:hypothetical protein